MQFGTVNFLLCFTGTVINIMYFTESLSESLPLILFKLDLSLYGHYLVSCLAEKELILKGYRPCLLCVSSEIDACCEIHTNHGHGPRNNVKRVFVAPNLMEIILPT